MTTSTLTPDDIRTRLYQYERVAEKLSSPAAFTSEHVWQYKQQGFLAVENLLSPAEVRSSVEGLGFLFDGRNPEYQGLEYERGVKIDEVPVEKRPSLIRKVWKFVDFEPRLKAMSQHPVLLDMCRKLVGEEVMLIQDMALLKPPHFGSEKPWHQDNAYFRRDPLESVIGAWIALDEATAENGCMHVIPNSHLKGPQPHHHARDCQLHDESVEVDRDVIVPLKPGGVLFFSGFTHHGTPPNQSAKRRWALQFHYAAASSRVLEAEEHARLFSDVNGYAGCNGATREAMLRDRYL